MEVDVFSTIKMKCHNLQGYVLAQEILTTLFLGSYMLYVPTISEGLRVDDFYTDQHIVKKC